MDKYDEAVAFLRENPDMVGLAWVQPNNTRGGCLFQTAGKTGRVMADLGENGTEVGCLTQVKGMAYDYVAQTASLTEAIVADERIPANPNDITVENLPVFAEWQRRLDKELGRA